MWLMVRRTSLPSWVIMRSTLLKLWSSWRHRPRQTPAPLSRKAISTRTQNFISLHSSNSYLSSTSFPFPSFPRAMYAHPNPAFSRAADSLGQSTSPANLLPLTIPLLPPNLLDQLTSEFDSVVVPESLRALNSPEVGTNNSSNCSGCSSCGSTGSLASHQTQRPSFIQRSVSSHSLLKNGFRQFVSSSTHEFVDSESGPVRRVFSTGDLQVYIYIYTY
jgi:hypothetical protein